MSLVCYNRELGYVSRMIAVRAQSIMYGKGPFLGPVFEAQIGVNKNEGPLWAFTFVDSDLGLKNGTQILTPLFQGMTICRVRPRGMGHILVNSRRLCCGMRSW